MPVEKLTEKYIKKLRPTRTRYEVTDAEVKQLTLRVSPDGHMAYYLRYRRPDGRQARAKVGDESSYTPSGARDEARRMLVGLNQGVDPIEAKRALLAKGKTLKEFIEKEYAPEVLAHRKSGAQDLARMKACFEDEFWDRRLSDPTLGNALHNWRSKRLKEGKEPATVNKDIAVLRAALTWAVEREYIHEHPLRKLKPLKLDRSPRVRYLDANEEKRLLDALEAREERLKSECDGLNMRRRERGIAELPDLRKLAFVDHLMPMVLLSLGTGLRRGEVFNLQWTDIHFDLTPPYLTVRGEAAKSGNTRHVPLNSEVVDVLKAWKAQTGGEGLVFKGKTGGRFDNCNTSWESLLKDAKITKFRWHDMRHHFASQLVMAGVDLNTVRELLGHGDIKMTLRYAHLAPHVKAKAVEEIVRRRRSSVVALSPEGHVIA